jgi:transposase
VKHRLNHCDQRFQLERLLEHDIVAELALEARPFRITADEQRLEGRPRAARESLLLQIADVEAAREVLVGCKAAKASSPIVLLEQLKGIGPEIASVLYLEGLFRRFGNRRQLAAYAGLAPTPWRSGTIDQEQGISKAGNPRLRSTMIELAWLWQRHQPASTLSRWFHTRVGNERGRIRRIST